MVVNYKPIIAPTYVTILASSSDLERGTVEGAGKYRIGETVTLIANAIPDRGAFAGWYNDRGVLVSGNKEFSFTAERDLVFVAKFDVLHTYTILLTDHLGTVASLLEKCTVSVDGARMDGDTFSLSTPNTSVTIEISLTQDIDTPRCVTVNGQYIGMVQHAGDSVSTSISYTDSNGNVSIDFEKAYLVTIITNIEGAGSPIGAGYYPYGYELTIFANPNGEENYILSEWQDEGGDTVGTEEEFTFIVTHDVTYKAVYMQGVVVTLVLGMDGAGTLSGGGGYKIGDSVSAYVDKNEGYKFLGWQNESGETVSTANPYTFAATESIRLTAMFAAPCYVTIVVNMPEAGIPTGEGAYEIGSSVTVNAGVQEGYSLVNWQDEEGNILSDDAEYTFVIERDIVLLAAYKVQIPSRLPSGYTEVEYIQSSGTQYINTGIRPTQTLRTVMDVEPTTNGGSSPKYFIYSYYSTNAAVYQYSAYRDNTGVNACMGGARTASWKNVSSDATSHRIQLEMDANTVTATADGNTVALTNSTFSTSMSNITVLSTATTSSCISAKLYSCQMYANEALVRDFVPCTNSSGAAGLYDIVGDKFYANAGTGKFTAGSAV